MGKMKSRLIDQAEIRRMSDQAVWNLQSLMEDEQADISDLPGICYNCGAFKSYVPSREEHAYCFSCERFGVMGMDVALEHYYRRCT